MPIGLTSQEAEKRRQNGQSNDLPKNTSKTVPQILRDNLFTYFNIVHLFLFSLVLFVEEYRNALFIVIILSNTVIGIVQEIRAKKIVDSLSSLTSPKARVVRDGTEQVIEASGVVLGDTVRFERGDKICADARVTEGLIEVNEALQTGEPDDIQKNVGDGLISGSYVTSGCAYAVLEKVGKDSFAHRLTDEAKSVKHKKSEILLSLNRVVKVMGTVIIPIGILLFLQQTASGAVFSEAVVGTVASVVGMIPAGLYLLTSIALTVGVIRLAQRQTLIRQMYSIESLARTDVLCIDKTGTLTTGKMTVCDVQQCTDIDASDLLSAFLFAQNAEDATSCALKSVFPPVLSGEIKDVIPFNSSRKWSACQLDSGTYVLGAYDRLIGASSDLFAKGQKLSEQGKRVVVFAKCNVSSLELSDIVPLMLISLQEEIRNGVEDTVKFFQDNHVSLRVISGDNPTTVSTIAALCGIDRAENYVDMTSVSDDDIPEIVKNTVVFGRVSPVQKQKIIRALQGENHTVAMTGDGVNDVLALKAADCGIALSSGADMARDVGEVVLLNNDWTSLRSVVMEGRRVIHNIERSGALFFVKTMYALTISLILLFWPHTYPFESIHMSLIGALTVGVPGFLLALEANENVVKGRFLRNMLLRAFPSALSVILSVVTLIFSYDKGLFVGTYEQVSSVAAYVTFFIGFVTLATCCVPVTKYRIGVYALCAVLAVVAVCCFPAFFSLCPLTSVQISWCTVLCACSLVLILFFRFLFKNVRML